jgi:6-pyruvoyl-tetrahydropterin synthase
MLVELQMWGSIDDNGIMEGMEFGDVKQVFRHFLDTSFDHHLLLNQDDPFAKVLQIPFRTTAGETVTRELELPGLAVCTEDPTTENLAKWIGGWAISTFDMVKRLEVVVHETRVNMASWEWSL